ncbi:MAG: hypothetical protein WDO16_12860 [Bacteroidota bacterium]
MAPFYDYAGADANTNVDHGPMIIAPYKFTGHSGWQGVAHSTTFSDGNGQYFIAHQGRPGIDKYYMNLHVRKLFWTADGWPVASPERYAWEKDSLISQPDVVGEWEQIVLGYKCSAWLFCRANLTGLSKFRFTDYCCQWYIKREQCKHMGRMPRHGCS